MCRLTECMDLDVPYTNGLPLGSVASPASSPCLALASYSLSGIHGSSVWVLLSTKARGRRWLLLHHSLLSLFLLPKTPSLSSLSPCGGISFLSTSMPFRVPFPCHSTTPLICFGINNNLSGYQRHDAQGWRSHLCGLEQGSRKPRVMRTSMICILSRVYQSI